MKTFGAALLALSLLPANGRADPAPPPWAASAQAPTSFAVPLDRDASVMAQALSLLNAWKDRDIHMYPMPIRADAPGLIQTYDPTALGLFGVKITDTHTEGVALITIETRAYEGKIFQISQQRHEANKRAHLLAYLLEQSAGVEPTESPLPPFTPSTPGQALEPSFAPSLDELRTQLDGGQYEAALATLDALRAAIVSRSAAKK